MPEAKRKGKKWAVLAVVVAIVAVAGAGLWKWHEMPSFCASLCHIEQTYVDNYMQDQGVSGTDKYGNEVSNTNAMMATLHRETKATAKPEILCVDCHIPNMMELAHDGVSYTTGNYVMPRDERSAERLMSWDGLEGSQFCVNDTCHVYLRGADGLVDKTELAKSTEAKAAITGFNPHEQHHEGIDMSCTSCHKGHRASVVMCTSCHEHEDITLPDGWITAAESNELMSEQFPGYYDDTYKSLPRAA